MGKVYVATKDDLNQTRIDLAARFAVAEQSGSGATQVYNSDADGTPVGRVVFDCVLRDGYVKANGATVNSASQDYPRLVEFVLNHPELLAADEDAYAANTALYMYNVTSDVMTLPNYIGQVMQGGNAVVSVEAGLPNITGVNDVYYVGQHEPGQCVYDKTTDMYMRGTGAIRCYSPNYSYLRNRGMSTNSDNTRVLFGYSDFDASRCSLIYGASSTVQPPAITLIPQIRY